jgi:hypothetical protein
MAAAVQSPLSVPQAGPLPAYKQVDETKHSREIHAPSLQSPFTPKERNKLTCALLSGLG